MNKLDPIKELVLERVGLFNVQTLTMPLWLFNMQNRKRKVLTINSLLIMILFQQRTYNDQVWASCGRFKIRLTPLFQDVQNTVNRLAINLPHLRTIKCTTVSLNK